MRAFLLSLSPIRDEIAVSQCHLLQRRLSMIQQKSPIYLELQVVYSIYGGSYNANKPRTSIAPPVQLFHRHFLG